MSSTVGKLTSTNDAGSLRRGTVSYQGRVDSPTVLHTPYGLIHNPPSGSMVVLWCQNGKDSNLIGIADNPAERGQKSLATGEVGLENYSSQSYIILRANGDIEISCENDVKVLKSNNVDVNASSSATVTSPNITLNGNVIVNGTFSQAGGGAVSFSGDINASGQIAADGDVIGAGVSLETHIHSGVVAGGDVTGEPV